MECCQGHSLSLLHLLIFYLCLSFLMSEAQALPSQRPFNNKVSAILVFGDSTVDPGNNNYITTAFKSDFPPYGRDFTNQIPTGRFTNGRLTTDFIASYVGLKDNVPPYLDPTLSIEELMTGVSFASAGSGFDPLTPRLSNVIQISKQMEYFREYKQRIEWEFGKQRMEDHIKKAAFILSAGTNDFVVNYFGLPIRGKTYSVSTYQQFVLENFKQIFQGLWDEGARRIGIVGLPPMGCLPYVITMNSNNALQQRACIEKYSSVATDYNLMLQNEINLMQRSLVQLGAKIYYADIYGPLMNIIQAHDNFGIDVVSSGCCGTGYLEAAILCNQKSYVCPDASKYVFWDSIHPTERTYYNVFKDVSPIIDLMIKD